MIKKGREPLDFPFRLVINELIIETPFKITAISRLGKLSNLAFRICI